MTGWIGALFFTIGFVILLRLFAVAEKSSQVVSTAHRSYHTIRNKDLSDEEKEKALQENAKKFFILFISIAMGGGAAILAPLGILWTADRYGLLCLDGIFEVLVSPLFLIIASVLAVLVFIAPRSLRSERTNYSPLEKGLHHLAFKTGMAQVAMADMEDSVYARQLDAIELDRPVFVTALPRAGTTLLLECFSKLPEFASHCYRDMPFVLTPCFWNRFSDVFRKTGALRQRAHGDGMLINQNSPEALEEVVWKRFWRKQYRTDRIAPWPDQTDDEFATFYYSHMRKIILLRREQTQKTRYVSKNNLNIARIRLLRHLFPGAKIIVPVRHPMQQAASLLTQHLNFLTIHANEPFASTYMRAIGHYDFGENLRPVDFGNWMDTNCELAPTSFAYWLTYWTAAYSHLLDHKAHLLFLCFDSLWERPRKGLERLGEAVDINDRETFTALAATIRMPRRHNLDTTGLPSALIKHAEDLYTAIKFEAINRCRS